MKAAEVLRLYEAGERDFKGVSLRGQKFNGKDLSGSDFSGADIRSANFTNANLTKVSFTNAKAGLKRNWAVGLVVVSSLISFVAGFLSMFSSAFVALIFNHSSLGSQVTGWLSLAVIVVFLLLLLRKGIGTLAIAIAVTVALAITIAVVVALDGGNSGGEAMAIALAGALAGAGVVSLAVVFAGALAVDGAIALVGALAGALVLLFGSGAAFAVGSTAEAVTGALAVVTAITLVSTYVAWRALTGEEKDAWIRSVAIAFSAIGGTSFRGATLTDADFSQTSLKSTDFRRAVLLRTRWRDAENLDRVRPGKTYLNNPKIRKLVCTGDGQGQSYDHLINLEGINLQGANLEQANFNGSTLENGTLKEANIARAYFIGANLNGVNLKNANLSHVRLVQAQLDEADLTGATLTGAYIEDWNITIRTRLDGICCKYVFMRLPPSNLLDNNPRRKPDDWDKNFEEGDFADFIAPMVHCLDLYHNQTVDPRIVAISFNNLREQNPETEINIVSMEKRGKKRDKFLLRAEVSPQANLSELNSQYFEYYDYLRTLPAEALRALLIEKDIEVERLARFVDTAIDRPSHKFVNQYRNQGDVIMSAQGANAPKKVITKQIIKGPAGNIAGTNYGNMSAVQNIYGSNTEDITRLLTALRDQAQSFPTDQKDDANDVLDDLERDLKEEQPDQGRISRRLKKLVALGAAIGTIASGAAAVSGDVSTFTGNVIELTEQLGIPVEQVQLPASGTP